VSLNKLALKCKIGKTIVQRAVAELERLGLVEDRGSVLGGKVKGIRFKVNLPSTIPSQTMVGQGMVAGTMVRETTVTGQTTNKDLQIECFLATTFRPIWDNTLVVFKKRITTKTQRTQRSEIKSLCPLGLCGYPEKTEKFMNIIASDSSVNL